MKKRIVSLLLVLCTLVPLCSYSLSVSVGANEHYTVTVESEGEAVENITVPESEKAELTCVCSPVNASAEYQWQICADVSEDLWVDIYGSDERILKVSYSLMASALDDSGSAYLRARVKVNGTEYFSESVCATVAFNAKFISEAADVEEKAPVSAKKAPMKKMMLLGAEPEPTPEYVTITINYLNSQDNNPLYSPYTATIVSGSEFRQTVLSPTFLGYAPYIKKDGVDVEASSYEINYSAGELIYDVVFDIYYKPIEVNYAVRYFFQNVNNDLYTENTGLYKHATAETGTIVTNETLEYGLDASTTEGFSKLFHYPERVAADGSTVFECYYDRNYYFYKFDLNGGYGVDPIYARYGTPFTVTPPVRHGYEFVGWADVTDDPSNTVTSTLPDKIGAGDKTYKAIWQTVNTTYSVVYWLENADDDGYSYWYSDHINATSNSTVNGSIYNIVPSALLGQKEAHYAVFHHHDGDKTVEGDGSTVVNVYFNRKQYNLRFYYAMESEVSGEHHYYVVGGSTYYFGADSVLSAADKKNDIKLIDQYNDPSINGGKPFNQRGEVDALPQLNTNGESKGYDKGYEVSTVGTTTYEYHYVQFSAKYGSNIEDKWPIDILNPVTRISEGFNDWGNWKSYVAYPSAWNGENSVKYNYEGPKKDGKVNQTIKGKYSVLDDMLLWYYDKPSDPFGEPADDTVSYLCFWENGAPVNWSVPERYQYKIWLPCLDGVVYPPKRVWTPNISGNPANGRQFYLHDDYATYDNSAIAEQTKPAITGFTNLSIHDYQHDEVDIEHDENGKNKYREYWDFNVFYSRNSYDLKYVNYDKSVLQNVSTPYEQDISHSAPEVLNYPTNLEPNAYEFEGWYTTPEGFEGTEYDLTNATMPANALVLYAKWVPKQHTVRFFATSDDMLAYEADPANNESKIIDEADVNHGEPVGNVDKPTDTSGHGYTFGGWFYVTDSNEVHIFAEYDTPVKRDINVYANWGSKTAQPYRIHYALFQPESGEWDTAIREQITEPKNQYSYTVTHDGETRGYVYIENEGDGKFHQLVADDTTGYAYEGSTRTFNAKAGDPYNQLYDLSSSGGTDFNDGYYPTLSSHSITVAGETTGIEQPEHNVYTFFYVQPGGALSYTVYYKDKLTGVNLGTDKVDPNPKINTTSKAVITERFVAVTNMIPDAFYKRLILSVKYDEVTEQWIGNDVANVITFYYTENNTATIYAVHFMLQKLYPDGSLGNENDYVGGYEESSSIIEGIADINANISITPVTFDGFGVKNNGKLKIGDDISDVSRVGNEFRININSSGTALYIYYTRKVYDVQVKYYKYNTTEDVDLNDLSLVGTPYVERPFGSVVSHTAPEIVSGWALVDPANQIKSTVVRSNVDQNVIVFYYTQLQYTVEYKIAGGVGGTLSQEIEVINSSGSFEGSIAKPSHSYKFLGWFTDEECTQPVNLDRVTPVADDGKKFIPLVGDLEPEPTVNVFYAKFELMTAYRLTIERSDAGNEGNGSQVFVYEIRNKFEPEKVYYVTITGNGSKNIYGLPVSTYEVKQMNDWSWRFDDVTRTVTLYEDGMHTVIFSDFATKDKWLNGNSAVVENKRGS